MKIVQTLPVLLLTVGCATNISQLGPDTYMASGTAVVFYGGGANTASKESLGAAYTHCAKLGKEVLVENIVANPDKLTPSQNVIFKCLDKGDPQLVRPKFENSPSIVIQDNRTAK